MTTEHAGYLVKTSHKEMENGKETWRGEGLYLVDTAMKVSEYVQAE